MIRADNLAGTEQMDYQRAQAPLLSICIPLYNGAAYLPGVLAAIAPQAADAGDRVEVIVIDDSSSDDSGAVVAAMDLPPSFRFIRNPVNLGMARNIASAMCQHARGEYVWVMSQHNLLLPSGLTGVLEALSANPHLDAFYINFRCATYPTHWPASAVGGYHGPFHYLCRTDQQSRQLDRWEELLQGQTCVCTQTYGHIARRTMVRSALYGQTITRAFDTAIDAYTQTWAVANSMFGRPAFYIGQPVLTIYNGAQTWSSLSDQAKVWLKAYPDLLGVYKKLGWKGPELKKAEEAGNQQASAIMRTVLSSWHPAEGRMVITYLLRHWRSSGALSAFLTAAGARLGPLPNAMTIASGKTRQLGSYFFVRWRPARAIRGWLK